MRHCLYREGRRKDLGFFETDGYQWEGVSETTASLKAFVRIVRAQMECSLDRAFRFKAELH